MVCLFGVCKGAEVSLALTFHVLIFHSFNQALNSENQISTLRHHHLLVLNPPLTFGEHLIGDIDAFFMLFHPPIVYFLGLPT